MIRGLFLAGLLVASVGAQAAGFATGDLPQDSPLSAPGDYSLAPPGLLAGGVASTSFGSGGMRSSSVRLDSGLLGGSTRAFLLLGAGQGPQLHGRPVASGSAAAVGVATALPFGTTLSMTVGSERERFSGRGTGFPASLGPDAGIVP